MLRVGVGDVHSKGWKSIVLPKKDNGHGEEYNVAVLPDKFNNNAKVQPVNVVDLDVLLEKANDKTMPGGTILASYQLRLTMKLEAAALSFWLTG